MTLTMNMPAMKAGQGKKSKFKVAGLALSGETMMYVLFIIVIMAVVVLNWNKFLDLGRLGSQYLEMSNIQTAASSYAAHRRDGEGPSSMQDLIDGVAAADSITGAAVTDLLNADSGRFKGGVYKDAFGSDFVFGTNANGNRYIASPGPDRQAGTDDDLYAYY